MSQQVPNLEDLLPEKLVNGLMDTERKLWAAALAGVPMDYSSKDEKLNDPACGANWGSERTLRAAFVRWICVDKEASELIDPRGVHVKGAKISGKIDFAFCKLLKPLALIRCCAEDLNLTNADAQAISLNESVFKSINADDLFTKGNLFLENVTVEGEVWLLGSNIGGNLQATGASFKNKGVALNADGISTGGDTFLNKVIAEGEVRFIGANIRGDLSANGAIFKNENGKAFSADGISTKGNIFFKKVIAEGEVRFIGANIIGDLSAHGATFNSKGKFAVNAEKLTAQTFFFLPSELNGSVDLLDAKVGQLHDNKESWPATEKLHLDGFEYGAFAGYDTPKTARERLTWLRLQPKKPFHPQPYEQLAKVFKQMGHESDRKKVLIAKQNDLRKYGDLGWWAKAWNWLLRLTVSYGYRPWQILLWILPVLLIGYLVFGYANRHHFMQPSDARVYMDKDVKCTKILPEKYPKFNPAIYSVDAFFPFLNLYEKAFWLPDASRGGPARYVRYYLWLHIALGWFFSTIFVAGISRILRE